MLKIKSLKSSATMEATYAYDGRSRCVYQFTGKERDTETGNDYFGARYYGSNMGRFSSPDDASGQDQGSPQSWNLYSYVLNNPINSTDPDGHDCVVQTRTDAHHETVTVSSGNCDNVNIGDGQSKTYVAGTVSDISAGADGKSIDIGYKPYDGSSSISVMSAGAAPIPDRPGLAYGYNASGYRLLGQTAATMNDGRTWALWYGASAVAGASFYAAGLTSGAEVTSILTEDMAGVLSRAGSAVGNQGAKVASREVAEQAAKEWVGEGARPITDRVTGKVIGEISADGTKVARFTSAESKGYINLVNKITGGNLHVRW